MFETLPDDTQWRQTVMGLAAGDQQICEQFWREYGKRLERLVDSRLRGAIKTRFGADDVVQSACRSFFRRLRDGQFELPTSDSLWRLLCAIALTKLREKSRFHRRKRRNADQTPLMGGDAANEPSPTATPDEEVAFADEVAKLLDGLEERQRRVAAGKLEGYTNEEIAEQMNCSVRTVSRLLREIRRRWRREILDAWPE